MANARIDGAIAIVGTPLDRRLVWEALQAAGVPVDFADGHYLPEGNKPLAGVGDRVMALVVTDNARDEGLRVGTAGQSRRRLLSLTSTQVRPTIVFKQLATMKSWLHFATHLDSRLLSTATPATCSARLVLKRLPSKQSSVRLTSMVVWTTLRNSCKTCISYDSTQGNVKTCPKTLGAHSCER